MLATIRSGPLSSSDDPVDHLLACHERIRRFSTLGAQLAEAEVAPAEEIREAAHSVHRYFSVALPLHVADEDESVRPRLLAFDGAPRAVREAVESMTEQHTTIEELLAEALLHWAALAEDATGARADAAREALDDLGHQLARLFHLHLGLEEEVIFPTLRRLPADDKAAITAEMRARRSPEEP